MDTYQFTPGFLANKVGSRRTPRKLFRSAFSSPQRFKHAERHSERRWGALRPKRPGGAASLQGLEAVTDTQGITSP